MKMFGLLNSPFDKRKTTLSDVDLLYCRSYIDAIFSDQCVAYKLRNLVDFVVYLELWAELYDCSLDQVLYEAVESYCEELEQLQR